LRARLKRTTTADSVLAPFARRVLEISEPRREAQHDDQHGDGEPDGDGEDDEKGHVATDQGRNPPY